MYTYMKSYNSKYPVTLNYVESGLSRLCGEHGELPHEVYLMELHVCELSDTCIYTMTSGRRFLATEDGEDSMAGPSQRTYFAEPST